jgi:UDP-N-acetylmuramate-alanine ligase
MTAARQHFHVAGVAGVGMSALAQALLFAGHRVTGSDRYLDQGHDLDVLKTLAAAGVELVRQDGTAIVPGLAGLVVSTAIEQDNADVVAAKRAGVPIIHRADMLARLAAGRRVVAITGTSGKTTVTGLVGHLLAAAGADPVVVNGGVVLNWMAPNRVGNVRWGTSHLWVVEADESDKSLLHFTPEWAVITTISKDHFELDEVSRLFADFAGRVKEGLVCTPEVQSVLSAQGRFGLPRFHVAAPDARRAEQGWSFTHGGVVFDVPLLGRHNAENAFTAVRLCERLAIDLGRLRDGLRTFGGIHRRLEVVGRAGGVAVIDDYAHNPAKIAASWSAVAETASPVIAFWRPHGYGPLALMKDELASSFAAVCKPQDRLYILPVFYVGGTASKSVTSEIFADELRRRGVNAEAVEGFGPLADRVLALAEPGGAVLGMGARDPELPLFARKLAAALAERFKA